MEIIILLLPDEVDSTEHEFKREWAGFVKLLKNHVCLLVLVSCILLDLFFLRYVDYFFTTISDVHVVFDVVVLQLGQ